MGKLRNALRNFWAALYSDSNSGKLHARDRQLGPINWSRLYGCSTPIRPQDLLPNQVSKYVQFEPPFCMVYVRNCQKGQLKTIRLNIIELRRLSRFFGDAVSLMISKKQDRPLLCM